MQEMDTTSRALIEALRSEGWTFSLRSVSRLEGEQLEGESYTVLIFTHSSGRRVKGEGRSDAEALAQAVAQLIRQTKPERAALLEGWDGVSRRTPQEIARDVAKNHPLLCGACGGALPNPACGHGTNGIQDASLSAIENLTTAIVEAIEQDRALSPVTQEQVQRAVETYVRVSDHRTSIEAAIEAALEAALSPASATLLKQNRTGPS